jgi:hypothetical protein
MVRRVAVEIRDSSQDAVRLEDDITDRALKSTRDRLTGLLKNVVSAKAARGRQSAIGRFVSD